MKASGEPERSAGVERGARALRRVPELKTLSLLALLGFGLVTFAAIADEVLEGERHVLDERALLALRNPADHSDPLGPRWLEEMGRDVTALGSVAVLTGVVLAAAGAMLLAGRRRAVLLLVVAVAGGWVISTFAKRGFARPRPGLVPHEAWVYTASFPSGHAMMSAVTYLTIAALLSRLLAGRLRAFVVGWAILLTLLTGASRVYLGVHWPTDVIAGWALGASWAIGCWLVAAWLEGRRRRTAARTDASKAT